MKIAQLCIPAPDHVAELSAELDALGARRVYEADRSIALSEDRIAPAWAQCTWRDVQTLEVTSIGDAQKKLRAIAPRWRYFGDRFNRRGTLIAAGLNVARELLPIRFPSTLAGAPPAFTLAESGLVLYSHAVDRPTVDGTLEFVENKTVPPSRAYLKLWEALTLLGDWPRAGDSVVDLGSSPGSWSWALAELGAQVLSIDRSPLDPVLSRFPSIEFKSGDAFALKPRPLHWVFSDVICYPEKLFDYVSEWLGSGHCKKYVCTLKFTGTPDPRIVARFRDLPHSRVLHLFQNKNEVTWMCHPKLA